jgi:hypothetical protein
VQEYAFRVDRERKESERKQIEAYGIRDFQQTVTQGISDSYVRWRGIEATLQLAQSPNTKIVIIGSGKDGLPVILGNVDTPIAPQPPAGGTSPAPDNSEAAKQKPSVASPPLLERTPASNLPTPAERPTPPSGPGAQPGQPGSSTQPVAPGPPAPPGAPGRQSSAPNQAQGSSWTLTISELQELLARALRSNVVETTGQGAPPPGGPGAPPPTAPGSAPHSPTSPPHAEPRMNTPPPHGPEPARPPEGPRVRPQ